MTETLDVVLCERCGRPCLDLAPEINEVRCPHCGWREVPSGPDVLARTDGMDRADWLALRKRGIGGSDAAAILGLDPYRSPLAVYLDKIGELPEQPENEAMEWGRRLEDAVAHGALDRLNAEREQPLEMRRQPALLRHRQHEWMLANLDREIHGHENGPAVLEVKVTGTQAVSRWEEDDYGAKVIPDRFILQTQHYIEVRGWDHAFIAVLIGGNTLLVEPIARDQALIDALLEVEERFWRGVQSHTPPPADGSDRTAKAIVKAFPVQTPGLVVELPAEAADLIAQRRAAAAAEKHAHETKVRAENRLKMMLREAEEGWLPGGDGPAVKFKEVAGGPVSYYREPSRRLYFAKDMTP